MFFQKTFMIRYLIFWDIKKLETPRISLLFTVGKESKREINQTGFFFWKYDQDQVLFANGIADGSE